MMASSYTALDAQALDWLLEQDTDNPGPRYMALRSLTDPAKDTLEAAQAAVMRSGPVPVILDNQEPEGYWVKPGPGYGPKYTGTTWSVLFLAQLGADGRDERVRRGCDYVLDNSRAPHGSFSANANVGQSIMCLWGNMLWALITLGWAEDERVIASAEMLARAITGEGYEGWYRRGGTQQPGFYCSANYSMPCAWGAVRALWGLGALPEAWRTQLIDEAIQQGITFLLSHDPAVADYPYKDRISSRWFQFHYPLGYVTDMLLNLEALAQAGVGPDPRLDNALAMIRDKQQPDGRWLMEHTYNGKLWSDIEARKQPSKWVTLRALRVLRDLESETD